MRRMASTIDGVGIRDMGKRGRTDRNGRQTMTGPTSGRSNRVSRCDVLNPTVERAAAATGARGEVRTLS